MLTVFRFKRSTDESFYIFDVSPSMRKASSEITSAHSKLFWKCFWKFHLECALVISEEAFRMEGETSKIKKLASVERLNLNISDPMNANLSSIFMLTMVTLL